LEALRAKGTARIVLDVPLLLENEKQHGLVGECDALVFIDAPESQRDARAVAQRGWPSGEVARREAAQERLDAKRARADYVIHNDGDLSRLEREVARVLAAAGVA
jgi:dephospho-CoA kinase